MSKHTPGPWEIDTRHGLAVGPCRIRMPDNPTAASMAAKMADARLIAAAPDLLQALKQLSAGLHDEIDMKANIKAAEVRAARAAIAKAEGTS